MARFLEILLIGVGLSMDAFAVSVCKGLGMKRIRKGDLFVIALFFGGFQALMPFIGWALGRGFEQYITDVDHWIAFVLLSLIGGKMLWDVFFGKEDDKQDAFGDARLDIKELLLLAVATSIDALAVGITFAFLSYPIGYATAVIGCTTFVLSAAGVVVGHVFGSRFEKRAQIAGGVILIAIGVKILAEHLGWIN